MMIFHILCHRDEIPPGGRAFQVQQENIMLDIFVIPAESSYVAYRNRCPHTGVNLDWRPNQFLDPSGKFIQCSTHGAKFHINDGYCVFGPCVGDSLKPVSLREMDGWLEIGFPTENTNL